jgi:hypothetical protein
MRRLEREAEAGDGTVLRLLDAEVTVRRGVGELRVQHRAAGSDAEVARRLEVDTDCAAEVAIGAGTGARRDVGIFTDPLWQERCRSIQAPGREWKSLGANTCRGLRSPPVSMECGRNLHSAGGAPEPRPRIVRQWKRTLAAKRDLMSRAPQGRCGLGCTSGADRNVQCM